MFIIAIKLNPYHYPKLGISFANNAGRTRRRIRVSIFAMAIRISILSEWLFTSESGYLQFAVNGQNVILAINSQL